MSKNESFSLEYTIRSSPGILFNFISTAAGLSQWFADSADIEDNTCTFIWNGSPEQGKILEFVDGEYVRYQMDYHEQDEYFELRIVKNEVTGDTILIVTDFAAKNDVEDQKLLWDSQIKTLIHQIGG